MVDSSKVLNLMSKALVVLACFLKSGGDMYMLLFIGWIFLVFGLIEQDRCKFAVAGFMTFQLLLVLYYLRKDSNQFDHSKNEDELINETICWKYAYGHAWGLSGDVNVLYPNLIDEFANHGLISFKRRDNIVDRVLGEEKTSSNDLPRNATPRSIHFYLLTRDFRKTDDNGYKIYCYILQQIPEFEKIGLQLCHLCELCCVELLNGSMLENGSCRSNSSAARTPTISLEAKTSNIIDDSKWSPNSLHTANMSTNGVRFTIDSTCKNVFDERKAVILADLAPLPVEVKYIDEDDYDNGNPSISVFSASLVCTRNRVLASLILSVEPDEVDTELLKSSTAHVTGVDPKLVHVTVMRKHSTWILLCLPAQAAFELLSINRDIARRKQVIKGVASALRPGKADADYVSTKIQVSSMPPLYVFFPPKTVTSAVPEKPLEHSIPRESTSARIYWYAFCHGILGQ